MGIFKCLVYQTEAKKISYEMEQYEIKMRLNFGPLKTIC